MLSFWRQKWRFASDLTGSAENLFVCVGSKAISAAIRVFNTYASMDAIDGGVGNGNTHIDQQKLWTMLWQYAASHTPLWKVINTTTGEFCNLDDPHSDLKQWLLPGTNNYWIAVGMPKLCLSKSRILQLLHLI